MGGVGDFFFGSKPKQKSSSSSESGNHAFDFLGSALQGPINAFSQGSSMLGSLLGLNNYSPGTPAAPSPAPLPSAPSNEEGKGKKGLRARRLQQAQAGNQIPTPAPIAPIYTPQNQTDALEAFSNSTGMDFLRDQGVKALEGSQAGRGMLQSGATGQALMQFGQNLGKTHVMSFMDKLLEHSRLGLGAAGTLAGAGAWSKGSGTSSGDGGKTGLIPLAVSAAASSAAAGSDIRLKRNVIKVGETVDGISIYEYNYIDKFNLPQERQIGVMAHEVKELRPDAYIPNFIEEFDGVDYSKLGSLD
jgi:hypothetical protein